MKAYVITIENDSISQKGSQICIESSWKVGNEFSIERFDATTPDQVEDTMRAYSLTWNYPWEGEVIDFATGLIKKAYKTAVPHKRMACALSHYRLWTECIAIGEPLMVLEHDAVFVKKVPIQDIILSWASIIGLNNPLAATRKASSFDSIVKSSNREILPVPRIDSFNIPQGLAGNSAYIITPEGAEELLDLVDEFGLWPNDAIMCYQLCEGLAVTKTYYTQVQGLPSTTTS